MNQPRNVRQLRKKNLAAVEFVAPTVMSDIVLFEFRRTAKPVRSRPGHTLQISAKIISNKLHRLVKIIQTEEQIGYQRNSESPEAQIYDNENYSVSDGEVDGDDDYFN
ncbi:hypothetical protein CRE_14486 [Caenorhabditis remanei]|uniref:Uncharacterized protein n=1 Tax=Caenorhabditis remanei TaxID=31234 RepID=E3M965_CAERE|nr:hypothetical protein CRE_14486 [Caenorhabditis remanei]